MDKLEYIPGDLVYFETEKAKVEFYNPCSEDSVWVRVIENGGVGMNINLIIIIVLEYILTLAGAYLFLHANDFKYKFLGFLLVLIGLGIACVNLYTSTT